MGDLFPQTDGVLYFGNDVTGGNRTSSHHIARLLSRRERVVYVESPGLRPPTTSATDLRKIVAKLRSLMAGPRQSADGLTLETIAQLPLHRYAAVRAANRALLHASGWRIRRRHGIAAPISWFTVPHLAPLARRLGEALTVYYCVDDYAEMPGMERDAVRAMDDQLTRAADVVFVTSETLLARKRKLNPHTYVSPHGVDVAHFGRAQDPAQPIAPDIAHLTGPVVGYFGLIDGRTDLELVAHLAQQRPAWTFVMVGQFAVPAESVPRAPNIVYAGKQPYEALPGYGRRFDAVIMPYKVQPATIHANPLKLREYLAMGKPVVSIALPAVDPFRDVVRVAETREQFLAHLDQAVAAGTDPEATRRRLQKVADMSWEARFEAVVGIVRERLAEVRGGSSVAPPSPLVSAATGTKAAS